MGRMPEALLEPTLGDAQSTAFDAYDATSVARRVLVALCASRALTGILDGGEFRCAFSAPAFRVSSAHRLRLHSSAVLQRRRNRVIVGGNLPLLLAYSY